MDLFWKPVVKRRTVKKRKIPEKLYHVKYPGIEDEENYIGEIFIGSTNNILPEQSSACSILFKSIHESDVIVCTFENHITAVINLEIDVPLILDLVSTKVFSVKFFQCESKISIQVYFTALPIVNYTARTCQLIKDVFSIIFKISDHSETADKSQDTSDNIDRIYGGIKVEQKQIVIPRVKLKTDGLNVQLRPYQEDAVQWMLHREMILQEQEPLHPCYCEIKLPSDKIIFYDKYQGYVVVDRPSVKSLRTGGILADEMGLGKTVEIFALVLNNPPEGVEYLTSSKESRPVVTRQSKKRALEEHSSDTDYVMPNKRSKVRDDFVKGKSKKGQNYVALENWYLKTLSSMTRNSSENKNEDHIECICGSTRVEKVVTCIDCFKIQHADCMSFKGLKNKYRCPQCWKEQPLLKSKGTLIVCPQTLKNQWIREICNLLKSDLAVFEYEGSNVKPIYPSDLKKYDLVITTYSVLQKEFKFTGASESKSLRTKSRYAAPGSPISLINWWRVCLDEAQTVESSTSVVSEMAQKLTATHRWAITGTPMSKGLSDIFGIIDYLQMEPFSDLDTWNNFMYKPFINGNETECYSFLSKVLWRTKKCDVLNQINIPEQTVLEYQIDFSPVERYFYDREHELSCNEFAQKLQNLDLNSTLKSLNKKDLKNLMKPLLSLRQVCAHHAAVKGRYLATSRCNQSMEGLLDALIARNLNDCDEYLRAAIASYNGLAGIHLLLSNPNQAKAEYLNALDLAAKYLSNNLASVPLNVDNLQMIHALHNLTEVHERCSEFAEVEVLKTRCATAEAKYIEKFNKKTRAAKESLMILSNEMETLEESLQLEQGQWFTAALDFIAENNHFQEFQNKLDTVLTNNYENIPVLNNEKRILFIVEKWDTDIHYSRNESNDAIDHLLLVIGDDQKRKTLTKAAALCHLRPIVNKKAKELCNVCETNILLKSYESKLFYKNKEEKATLSWKPTIEEKILRVLCSTAKSEHMDEEMLKDGDTYLNIYDVYKKEFKELRRVWTHIDQEICAYDEIDICKIRLCLRDENAQKESKQSSQMKNLSYNIHNPIAKINEVGEHELGYQLNELNTERISNTRMLEKFVGTNNYLRTLSKRHHSGQTLDPCPICKAPLTTKWNILKCGHCYCLDCMQLLIGNALMKSIQCSICREKQSVNEINFIEAGKTEKTQGEFAIKGNCSTKVEVITRHVLKLRESDPDIKILIFSNWTTILKVLESVFVTNGISSILMSPFNQSKLDNFKDASKGVSTLLLPIHLGARGLNVIEATHVIFVEPLLDPAEELQAVGRIHRIGQTRPTFVHKFLVNDSIEENIHSATSSAKSEWHKDRVTLHKIKALFTLPSMLKSSANPKIATDSSHHSNQTNASEASTNENLFNPLVGSESSEESTILVEEMNDSEMSGSDTTETLGKKLNVSSLHSEENDRHQPSCSSVKLF